MTLFYQTMIRTNSIRLAQFNATLYASAWGIVTLQKGQSVSPVGIMTIHFKNKKLNQR